MTSPKWSLIPNWLRHSIVGLLGALAMWITTQATAIQSKPSELHQIHVEVGRMGAGFKAFVETQPPKVKVQIYEAMNRYDDSQRVSR